MNNNTISYAEYAGRLQAILQCMPDTIMFDREFHNIDYHARKEFSIALEHYMERTFKEIPHPMDKAAG